MKVVHAHCNPDSKNCKQVLCVSLGLRMVLIFFQHATPKGAPFSLESVLFLRKIVTRKCFMKKFHEIVCCISMYICISYMQISFNGLIGSIDHFQSPKG